jgi:mRNA interferase RelE/StbE
MKFHGQLLIKLSKKIDDLINNPFPPNSSKLSGTHNNYRIRVGDFRIVYEIDKNSEIIWVLYIRNRRDVYREI